MNKSLVTGGAGFIGSHLVEHLLQADNRVVVIDDFSTGCMDNLAHLRKYDSLEVIEDTILNRPVLEKLVGRVDRVFHLAAAVGVKLIVDNPAESIEANITGTDIVLQCCAERQRPILITSSSEVYGKSECLPFQEDADVVLGPTTRARWSYACAKAVGEFLAHAYARKAHFPVVITRLFNTTGPRQTGQYGMAVPRFVGQALSGEPITVYGTGEQTRCFSHVHDVVPALVKLIETPAAHGAIVNIGSDTQVTIRHLAQRVKDITGSSSEIVKMSFEEVYGKGFEDMNARQPDLTRARSLIGFNPTRALDEIIADVVAHNQLPTQA